jgi:hypothetical protein
LRKIRFRHLVHGEVVETDVILCRRDRWAEQPEFKNPAWGAVNVGRRLVLAVQAPVLDIPEPAVEFPASWPSIDLYEGFERDGEDD